MKITKAWLVDTAERTLWTFLEAFAATFLVVIGGATVGNPTPGLGDVPWVSAASIGVTAGILAVLKSAVRQTKATPPKK